jgi:predicted esterase
MLSLRQGHVRVRKHRAALGIGSLAALVCVYCIHLAAGHRGQALAESGGARLPDARSAAVARPEVSALPRDRQTIATEGGAPVHVFPPLDRSIPRAPLVVMLHGMCSDPLATCDFWSPAGREGSWLVCPAGNGACGGRPDWSGSGEEKARAIDAGIDAVTERWGSHVDHGAGDVLIGFSRGAFVARDVVYARPGRYRGLILVGAAMVPDAERFKSAGIRRVVLASGDYDGARPMMQKAARTLGASGLDARYVSLGPIGHALPKDFETVIRNALRWIRSAP